MSIDTRTMLAAAVVVAACAGERTAAAQATRGYVGATTLPVVFGPWFLGLSSIVYRPAVGIRAAF